MEVFKSLDPTIFHRAASRETMPTHYKDMDAVISHRESVTMFDSSEEEDTPLHGYRRLPRG